MSTSAGTSEQGRTRRARAAVVRSAAQAFVQQGYAATSIARISADSSVPAATVYRLFGNKLGILKAVMDVAIAGDDEPLAVAQRPAALAATGHAGAREKVAGFVAIMVSVNQRIRDLYWVVADAARVDPEARALLAELDDQRDRGQGRLVAALHQAGQLRPGLTKQDADDIVHALMSPQTFRLLVGERSWPAERYAQWLTDAVAHQLLPD